MFFPRKVYLNFEEWKPTELARWGCNTTPPQSLLNMFYCFEKEFWPLRFYIFLQKEQCTQSCNIIAKYKQVHTILCSPVFDLSKQKRIVLAEDKILAWHNILLYRYIIIISCTDQGQRAINTAIC